MVAVVVFLCEQGRVGDECYDAIEFFAGAATLTAELRARGLRCATFEILDDRQSEDILSVAGFLYAVELIVKDCIAHPLRRTSRLGVRWGEGAPPNGLAFKAGR